MPSRVTSFKKRPALEFDSQIGAVRLQCLLDGLHGSDVSADILVGIPVRENGVGDARGEQPPRGASSIFRTFIREYGSFRPSYT